MPKKNCNFWQKFSKYLLYFPYWVQCKIKKILKKNLQNFFKKFQNIYNIFFSEYSAKSKNYEKNIQNFLKKFQKISNIFLSKYCAKSKKFWKKNLQKFPKNF